MKIRVEGWDHHTNLNKIKVMGNFLIFPLYIWLILSQAAQADEMRLKEEKETFQRKKAVWLAKAEKEKMTAGHNSLGPQGKLGKKLWIPVAVLSSLM